MDKEIIEKKAIYSLDSVLMHCDNLKSQFNSNDKEPSWDGFIYVYKLNSKNNAKKDLLFRVPVQVKGHYTQDLSDKTVGFQVSVDDLRNYKSNYGVIYFVVYVNEDDFKIYYNALVPQKIDNILKTVKSDSKTKKLNFKLFPQTKNISEKIRNKLEDFHNNQQKQQSYVRTNSVIPSIQDVNLKYGLDYKLIFEASGIESEVDLLNYSKQNDMYFYVQPENTQYQIPINLETVDVFLIKQENINIGTAEKVFYKSVQVTVHSDDSIQLKLSKNISFMCDSKNNTLDINITSAKMLRDWVNDLAFICSLIKNKSCSFDGNYISFDSLELNKLNLNLDFESERIIYLKQIVDTFDSMGISSDIDISKLTDNEQMWLEVLRVGKIENKTIDFLNVRQNMITIIKIQDIQIIIALNFDNISNSVRLLEITDESCVAINDAGTLMPIYCTFSANQLAYLSNIDFNMILKECKRLGMYENNKKYILNLVDRLISASDLLENTNIERRDVILRVALDVNQWMQKNTLSLGTSLNDYLEINEIEIKKRNETFDDQNDTEKLLELIDNTKDQSIIIYSRALLGEINSVRRLISKLSDYDREIMLNSSTAKFINLN